jgi:fatty acid amide hydrolase
MLAKILMAERHTVTQKAATNPIIKLGAREAARLIASGELSSREAVEACIARIQELNPSLKALVVETFERARTEADTADAARKDGKALGPLHGVPITIKEQFCVAGTPSTFGLKSQAKKIDESDGPLVAALRDAGAIILGKTNVSQFLMYIESDNPVYGQTRNPWDHRRTPGGSSGGEAAAISAGMSFLGLGCDLGGSIREPAHFCGVQGLKPTSGRLTIFDTRPGIFPMDRSSILPQPGPMARNVEDLELAMEILTLPQLPDAPHTHPWLSATSVDLPKLRVAWFDDDGFFPASPAIRRAVREAVEALSRRGITTARWEPPRVKDAMRLYFSRLTASGTKVYKKSLGRGDAAPQIRSLFGAIDLNPATRGLSSRCLSLLGQTRIADLLKWTGERDADSISAIEQELSAYREEFDAALSGFDAIICPPAALPAIPHGTSNILNGFDSYAKLFNTLGMPAGVVAASRVRQGEESDRVYGRDAVDKAAAKSEAGSAGLPIGVQVAARWRREDIVLAVMRALESAFRERPDYPNRPSSLCP